MATDQPASGSKRDHAKIGVAIAAYNAAGLMSDCLRGIVDAGFTIVLYDDGSTDGTAELAKRLCPEMVVIRGTGEAWWGGGTRRAMDECFALGCDACLLLNPDVEIDAAAVKALTAVACAEVPRIVASLVVDREQPDTVAWAGSRLTTVFPRPKIVAMRYVAKRGDRVASLGAEPYQVDEAHGRGVVVPREVYERIGSLDATAFPHYGADNDYSMRARRADIEILVHPRARAHLRIENSGMHNVDLSIAGRLRSGLLYLFFRKHGEGLRVNWVLARRYSPRGAVVANFIYSVGRGLAGRLFRRP